MRLARLAPLLLLPLLGCPHDDDVEDDGSDAGDDEGAMDPGDYDIGDPDAGSDEGGRDEDGRDGDGSDGDGLLTWQELRTVTLDVGCEFEIMGEGIEVRDRELAALCPECDRIFEVETDIELACESEDHDWAVQVVNPYYRGIVDWGDDTIEVWMLTQAPHYDVEDAYFLAEVDASGTGRMHYDYSGSLGEPYGDYTVDAVLIVD